MNIDRLIEEAKKDYAEVESSSDRIKSIVMRLRNENIRLERLAAQRLVEINRLKEMGNQVRK